MVLSISEGIYGRVIPILQETEFISSEVAKRVVDIVLPFLSLHKPTSRLLSLGMGGCNCLKAFKKVRENEDESLEKVSKLVLLSFSWAFTLFAPKVGVILTQSGQLVSNFSSMGGDLKEGEFIKAGKDFVRTFHTAIYLASLVYPCPEWVFISTVAQTLSELSLSFQELFQGKVAEGVSHIALACIWGFEAERLGRDLHRDYFGKKLSIGEFRQICLEARIKGEKVFLEKALEEKFYSTYIEDIDFRSACFKEISMKGLRFQRCNFNEVDFERAHVENSSFTSCQMKNARCIDAIFQDTFFSDSSLVDTVFYRASFSNVTFSEVNLTRACFNQSIQKNLFFQDSNLQESNFLFSEIEYTHFSGCDVTNTIFADVKERCSFVSCTENKFTKPVVALSWNFENEGAFAREVDNVLKDKKITVLRFDYNAKVDEKVLDEEVQNSLQNMGHLGQGVSRAQILFSQKELKEVEKVKRYAQVIVDHIDGIFLPGGMDVHREFYGQKKGKSDWPDDHFTRDVYEMAILQASKDYNLPTMGVCRGAQVINVYYGGSLKNVERQMGVTQKLEKVASSSSDLNDLVSSIVGENFKAHSAHHQAVDELGEGLQVLLRSKDIPKLMMNEKGNIIASQFHPESCYELKKRGRNLSEEESLKRWIFQKLDLLFPGGGFLRELLKKIRRDRENEMISVEENEGFFNYYAAQVGEIREEGNREFIYA